jgi:flagellar motility protein MotE (MotC chaperone)
VSTSVKIENGKLAIDLTDLIDSVTDIDTLTELAERLSCHELIIEFVRQQVLDGYTDQGSHGSTMPGMIEPQTALDQFRRQIAERADDVARREIKDLKQRLASLDKLYQAEMKDNAKWRDRLGRH